MWIFEILHPDFSLSIGKMMSRSSRKKRVSNKLMINREKGLIAFAKKQFGKFDIVIMGHSHIPKLERFENGIYANAGDWVKHNSYLEMIDGDLRLNEK
jgi:UDP-2,3-diacylglucosamine hydrolase